MKVYRFCSKYLKNYTPMLVIFVGLGCLTGLVGLTSPYIAGSFVDFLVRATSTAQIYEYGIVYVALNLANLVLGYFNNMVYTRMQTQMGFECNADLIRHIQQVSYTKVSEYNAAYLSQRLNNDSNSLVIFCLGTLQNVVTQLAYFILPALIMFRINADITWMLLACLCGYILLYFVFRKSITKMSNLFREAQNHFFSSMNDNVVQHNFIKIHSVSGFFSSKLKHQFKKLLAVVLKNQRFLYAVSSIENVISTVVQIVLFIIGGAAVINGRFSIGMFTLFSSYFNMMLNASKYFFTFGKDYREVLAAYNRVQEVLAWPVDQNGTVGKEAIQRITVQDICFSYKDNLIVNHLSMEFEKGKMYAIIGRNGSGKTTLMYLLAGILSPTSGSIEFDSVAISNMDMVAARGHLIGVVEQTNNLLNESIAVNLVFNQPSLLVENERRIEEIVETLGLKQFLSSLPNGLDTLISEANSNLSGGEKQKLAILRLLLQDAPVMILDEPTSSMDMESAVRFYKYLSKAKKDKIIIMITHDPAAAAACDVVLKLEEENTLCG